MSKVLDFLTNPIVAAVLIPIVGGLLGTLLEWAGTKWNLPRLVALGQRIEGLLTDIPKLIRGSRKTAEENAKNDKGDGPKTPRSGAAVGLTALALMACSAKPETPPCDQATAARLTAEAALAGEGCAANGTPEDECIELKEINRRADERQAFCAKRIRED